MADNTRSEDMFSDLVRTIARGALDEDATVQLKELVKEMTRVGETTGGKPKGKITLTITFVLDRGVMDVDPRLSVVRPTPVRARSILYPQRDGGLSKEDVRQGRLFAGEVRDGVPNASDIR